MKKHLPSQSAQKKDSIIALDVVRMALALAS